MDLQQYCNQKETINHWAGIICDISSFVQNAPLARRGSTEVQKMIPSGLIRYL